MPYSVVVPVTPNNILWGSLVGKGGQYLRVKSDETGVDFESSKTPYTDAIMNADSTVAFHYDMSQVTYTSGNITAIADQSSSHCNVVGINLFTKSSSTQNGKYYGHFGRSESQYLTVSNAGCPTSGQSFMYVFLGRLTSNVLTSLLWNSNGSVGNLRCELNSTVCNCIASTTVGNQNFTCSFGTSWFLITMAYDSGSNQVFCYFNGQSLGGAVEANTGWTFGGITIGCTYQVDSSGNPGSGVYSTGYCMNGDIAEVAMIKTFDNTKRQEGLMAYKWGLSTSVLYSGHPFYGIQPYTS